MKVKVIELLDAGTVAGIEPLASLMLASLEDIPLIQAEVLVLSEDKNLNLEKEITVESKKISLETNAVIFVGSRLLEREDVSIFPSLKLNREGLNPICGFVLRRC